MPTTTLTAGAITSDGPNLAPVGGSDGAVLNSDDSDTSYVVANDNAGIERYALSDMPAYAARISKIDFTTWKARKADTNNRQLRLGIYLSGSTTNGATQSVTTGSYETFSDLALARPGGGIWSVDDINSSELVVEAVDTVANSAARFTYVLPTVTYAPAGGFFCLVSSLGPLAAVLLSEMPAIAKTVLARTGSLILPDEYVTAWRDLRAHTWPKHFVLG